MASLEAAEDLLTKRSQASASPMIQTLIKSLGSAIVYPDSGNLDTNRKLWDAYAAGWSQEERCDQQQKKRPLTPRPYLFNPACLLPAERSWVQSMARSSSSTNSNSNSNNSNSASAHQLECVGDEWSPKDHVTEVIADFIKVHHALRNTQVLGGALPYALHHLLLSLCSHM